MKVEGSLFESDTIRAMGILDFPGGRLRTGKAWNWIGNDPMRYVCSRDRSDDARKFPTSFADPSITGHTPRLTVPRGTTASSAIGTPGTWRWAVRFITTRAPITTSTRGTTVDRAPTGSVWTVSGLCSSVGRRYESREVRRIYSNASKQKEIFRHTQEKRK